MLGLIRERSRSSAKMYVNIFRLRKGDKPLPGYKPTQTGLAPKLILYPHRWAFYRIHMPSNEIEVL